MHEEDGDTVQRMPLRKSTRFRITASGEPVLVTPDSDALDVDSGENSGELKTGEPDAAEQMDVTVVYCKRKRNILWNVRVFRGIIEALKQQPRHI